MFLQVRRGGGNEITRVIRRRCAWRKARARKHVAHYLKQHIRRVSLVVYPRDCTSKGNKDNTFRWGRGKHTHTAPSKNATVSFTDSVSKSRKGDVASPIIDGSVQ